MKNNINISFKQKTNIKMTTQYYDIIKSKIITMITNDLTIGMTDNNQVPYTQEQINQFIFDHNDKINKAIENMIQDYTNDNELEELTDPPFNWIGEYLYEFINTINISN